MPKSPLHIATWLLTVSLLSQDTATAVAQKTAKVSFDDQALAMPADVFPNEATARHTADVFALIGRIAADRLTPRIWVSRQDKGLLRHIQSLTRAGQREALESALAEGQRQNQIRDFIIFDRADPGYRDILPHVRKTTIRRDFLMYTVVNRSVWDMRWRGVEVDAHQEKTMTHALERAFVRADMTGFVVILALHDGTVGRPHGARLYVICSDASEFVAHAPVIPLRELDKRFLAIHFPHDDYLGYASGHLLDSLGTKDIQRTLRRYSAAQMASYYRELAVQFSQLSVHNPAVAPRIRSLARMLDLLADEGERDLSLHEVLRDIQAALFQFYFEERGFQSFFSYSLSPSLPLICAPADHVGYLMMALMMPFHRLMLETKHLVLHTSTAYLQQGGHWEIALRFVNLDGFISLGDIPRFFVGRSGLGFPLAVRLATAFGGRVDAIPSPETPMGLELRLPYPTQPLSRAA